jgi:basic membrane protein A
MRTRSHGSRAVAVIVTILSLLLLAACGGGDDGDGGGNQAAAEEQLRVAFLLPGPVTDRGYNADGQRAADMIKSELGADVTVSESVQVPNQTDVYRQFANRGFDLVIGWGGQFTDGAVAVAEEFPDVKFLVVNSNASNGSNLASMDTAIEQWQFVGGYILARLSKKGVVGWVGGGCFPATAANLHGTEQGARHANEDIRFLSTFTGDFEDPTKARQAAQAMIDQGADALSGNLNNGWFGIYRAARQGGNLPVVTEWVDNHEVSPRVIASSILKSQARFVTDIAQAVQDGTFKGKFYKESLPDDWGPAVADTDLLPEDVYNDAIDVQEKIASGEIKPKHDESCPG